MRAFSTGRRSGAFELPPAPGPLPSGAGAFTVAVMVRATFPVSVLAVFLLAGCVSAPEPAPAPPPPRPVSRPVAPPPAPPSSPNWEDWKATPGDWAYRRDARGSVALFGVPGTNAVFLARCDTARARIYLSRGGNFAAGETGQMTIKASSATKSYAAMNSDATPPYVAAEVLPSDPHLDAMAYSRGKFIVSIKGAADLVVPTWAEFARVVEDCRG